MNLVGQLSSEMVMAASAVLGSDWKEVQPRFEEECKMYSSELERVAKAVLLGQISEEKARDIIIVCRFVMRNKLLALKGVSTTALHNGVNAAITACVKAFPGIIPCD